MPKYVMRPTRSITPQDLKNVQLHCVAYADDAVPVPIGSVSSDQLKFNGGFWRIQHKFNKPIQIVRGIPFVLYECLDRQENNLFKYHRAALVSENCYGKLESTTSYIVAKYETDDHTYYAYGSSIEEARAFLGIKIYDTYKDLIHTNVCKDKEKR